MRKVLTVIFALPFLFGGCREESSSQNIVGDWEWIKSTGGLLPERTPANTGDTETITIEAETFTIYRNGDLVETINYVIERDGADYLLIDQSGSGNSKRVSFSDPNQFTITWYGGENSGCADCETSYYIRADLAD